MSIVEALVECKRTKAYLDHGYSTLWKFLVDELGYSNGAASRRYQAMKCVERLPEALDLLRERRVLLVGLARIAPRLDEVEDPRALLRSIVDKNDREIDRELARLAPARKPPETVRARFVRSSRKGSRVEHASRDGAPDLFAAASGSAGELPACARSTVEPTDTAVEMFEYRFCVPKELHDEFERARAIVSRKTGGCPSIEETFAEMTRFFLEKKRPRKRDRKRNRKRPGAETTGATGTAVSASPTSRVARSRHVPRAVRDEVMLRDGERCTYVGPDGRRCGATHDLQIDHVVPFAEGGTHDPANLRVLCGAHNRRRNERVGERPPVYGRSRTARVDSRAGAAEEQREAPVRTRSRSTVEHGQAAPESSRFPSGRTERRGRPRPPGDLDRPEAREWRTRRLPPRNRSENLPRAEHPRLGSRRTTEGTGRGVRLPCP